jgi:hypothetical protein
VNFYRDHRDLPSLTAITNAAREQDLIEVLRILQNGNNLAKEYLTTLEGDEVSGVWDFTLY